MEVIAKSKYIRISPKKLNLVAAAVTHLPVSEAKMILANLDQKGARFLLLTLKQGEANAVKNFGLNSETLVIKSIEIGKGPTYKRGQPVSRSQWHPILKRTSHIKMVLTGEKAKENKKENKGSKEKKGGKKDGAKS